MTIPGYIPTTPACDAGDLPLYHATRVLDGLHSSRPWAEGKVDRDATFFFSLPRSIGGQR